MGVYGCNVGGDYCTATAGRGICWSDRLGQCCREQQPTKAGLPVQERPTTTTPLESVIHPPTRVRTPHATKRLISYLLFANTKSDRLRRKGVAGAGRPSSPLGSSRRSSHFSRYNHIQSSRLQNRSISALPCHTVGCAISRTPPRRSNSPLTKAGT